MIPLDLLQPKRLSQQERMFLQTKFVLRHRLPQQVFSGTVVNNLLFFEYARAFSDQAWNIFVRLAHECNEQSIFFATIEPDANDYYRKHFGMPTEVKFVVQAPSTVYTHYMHQWPPSSVADAPAYRADVVVWIGETGQWRCWGERASGICVLCLHGKEQVRNELILSDDSNFPILTVDQALSDVVSSEYNDFDAFKEFSDQFRSNYAL